MDHAPQTHVIVANLHQVIIEMMKQILCFGEVVLQLAVFGLVDGLYLHVDFSQVHEHKSRLTDPLGFAVM